eukprot:613114-Rhodomonas_salina.1
MNEHTGEPASASGGVWLRGGPSRGTCALNRRRARRRRAEDDRGRFSGGRKGAVGWRLTHAQQAHACA